MSTRSGVDGGVDGGSLRRFVLEHHPVRGLWVRLTSAWRELRSAQRYPPSAEALLGEAVTAAVLLAGTLKFRGTLNLTLQGSGLVRLLVAQCTHDLRVRAMARLADELPDGACFADLIGDGRLVVAIDAEERAASYQGIVALEGASLAGCLERYFATSEQLPTRLSLAADAACTTGVLVQQMPAARAQGEAGAAASLQAYDDLRRNLEGLAAPTLQACAAEQLLQGLCGEHDGRLFAGSAVQFACRCGPQRVAGLLRMLGEREVREVLAERGEVSVTCEFCGRGYRFDAIDVQRLFDGAAGPPATPTLSEARRGQPARSRKQARRDSSGAQ